MSDEMKQPRDEHGQWVSIGTLFERERKEHQKQHEDEHTIAKEVAQRMEREVEETAQRLERLVASELQAHDRIHGIEEKNRDKAAESVDKRLEGMNEFRDALQDQTNKFVTRELFDATLNPLIEFRARALGIIAVITLVAGAAGAAIAKTLIH